MMNDEWAVVKVFGALWVFTYALVTGWILAQSSELRFSLFLELLLIPTGLSVGLFVVVACLLAAVEMVHTFPTWRKNSTLAWRKNSTLAEVREPHEWAEQNPNRVAIAKLMAGPAHVTSQHPDGTGPLVDPQKPGEWSVVGQEWVSYTQKLRGFRFAFMDGGGCHIWHAVTHTDAEATARLTRFFTTVNQWKAENHPGYAQMSAMRSRNENSALRNRV